MLEEAEGGSDGVISARELEILLLAARGLSNRRIAARIRRVLGNRVSGAGGSRKLIIAPVL
jgi:hypothetical protein